MNIDPITNGAIDSSASDPIRNGGIDSSASDPITNGAIDSSTSDPITNSAIDSSTSDPITNGAINSSEPIAKGANDNSVRLSTEAIIDIDFSTSSSPKTSSKRENNKEKCPHCSEKMLSKNLKVHISRKHSPSLTTEVKEKNHEGVCVDRKNGIYLVSEKSSGVLYPIHVQKLISGNKDTKIYCESKKCIIQKTIAGISDDPTFECVHLKSVNSFLPSQDVILQESSLDYLVSQKRMELTTKNNCIKRKQ